MHFLTGELRLRQVNMKKGKNEEKNDTLLYEKNHVCTSARKTEEIYGTQIITNRLKCIGHVCSKTKNTLKVQT